LTVLRIPVPQVDDVDAARGRHLGKMAAVRRMAGAVVNELGGLLDGAAAGVRELLADCTPEDPRSDQLVYVRNTLQRAESVTRQLGTLARRGVLRAAPVELNGMVEQMLPLVRRLSGESIAVTFVPEEHTLWTVAEPGQVEQILLNLVVNARDAMPHGGGLRLSTQRWLLDFPHAHPHGVLAAGEWTVVEVSDSGTGMSDEVYEHLFEPFFTTKQGLGVGLGLAATYGIAGQLGGQLLVQSGPGEGSRFSLALPAMVRGDRRGGVGAPEAILVVDEDAWVRNVTSRILRRAGYGVLEAERGDEALELLRDVAGQCVRLALVDTRSTRHGGGRFHQILRQEHPSLRVLTMSANAEGSVADRTSVLHKPFTPAELLAAVEARLAPATS
jgi:nitrogen-specific signal transduction histidine kinase